MADASGNLFTDGPVVLPLGGPLYLQLKRWIEDAIKRGAINPGDALPSERDLAIKTDVSRVTVRKAVQQLVQDGVLVQRHGSGTFVAQQAQRVEQSLSQLTSFTEDMARRGMAVRAEWLDRGLYHPSTEETVILGLGAGEQVTRIARLRLSEDTPLAIERASLSSSILPDPDLIGDSLYKHLEKSGNRPVRAIQRIRAANLSDADAHLLLVPVGSAGLFIERISYLPSGRAIEFTRSIYRGDTYDFVAELQRAVAALPERLAGAVACDWSEMIPALDGHSALYVLGRGPGFAIANEAALKFKETCGIQGESYSAAEVMHGPVSIVNPGYPVLGLAARDAAEKSVADMAHKLAGQGASAFLTSDLGGAARRLPFAATGHPITDPLALVVSFYGFVEALARHRGLNPDEPPMLKKVTETL